MSGLDREREREKQVGTFSARLSGCVSVCVLYLSGDQYEHTPYIGRTFCPMMKVKVVSWTVVMVRFRVRG